MTKTTTSRIYPVLRYRDGRAAMDWLKHAFGFAEHFVAPGTDGAIVHAELRLGQDMVMLGGPAKPDPANPWGTEPGGIYVAVDDVDALHARALAGGADIVRPLADTGYGAREFSASDCDGHLWSFGTYRPEAPPA